MNGDKKAKVMDAAALKKKKEAEDIWSQLDLGDEDESEFTIGINDLKPR